MKEMMGKCMSGCRWFPIIPIIIGIIFFLLGYYLNAEIVRILWLICSGFWVLMGVFGFVIMGVMMRTMGKEDASDINNSCCD